MTDFPPPEGFTGYQSCTYGTPDERYKRACTEEEVAILTADAAAALANERAEDEELREAYFSMLRSELGLNGPDRRAELVSASIAETSGKAGEMDPEPGSG